MSDGERVECAVQRDDGTVLVLRARTETTCPAGIPLLVAIRVVDGLLASIDASAAGNASAALDRGWGVKWGPASIAGTPHTHVPQKTAGSDIPGENLSGCPVWRRVDPYTFEEIDVSRPVAVVLFDGDY